MGGVFEGLGVRKVLDTTAGIRIVLPGGSRAQFVFTDEIVVLRALFGLPPVIITKPNTAPVRAVLVLPSVPR